MLPGAAKSLLPTFKQNIKPDTPTNGLHGRHRTSLSRTAPAQALVGPDRRRQEAHEGGKEFVLRLNESSKSGQSVGLSGLQKLVEEKRVFCFFSNQIKSEFHMTELFFSFSVY